MTAFERVRDALESGGYATKDNGHGVLRSQCPAHTSSTTDSRPLAVRAIEGKALIHCHGGCEKESVAEALNLTMRDLFDNPKGAEYPYPGGNRTVYRTPDKQFRQKVTGIDRSLFHGDRINDAGHVYVTEGEQDVLAAEAVGAVAVSAAQGAGKAHLADWEPLRGKHVTVVADNDEPGRKHADQVAQHVLAAGCTSVRIVRAAVGKDLADHIAAEKTLEELVEEKTAQQPESTTWEAFDLGPWLNGEHINPQPEVGISRTDGRKLLYAGRDHTVFGETEAGKSWFALECVAVEMRMGRDVVYIHYEEGDPGSTIERLLVLGVTAEHIRRHLRFVAPARPVRGAWLAPLLDPPPVLVVHDGVNEAMSLHGDDTNQSDGAATFRRTIIKPFLAVGAASLSCDHVVKNSDSRGRYAIGSGHKVNAIDGAAFFMENIEPFGRGLRGASSVYVTKDRPGQLRAHGKATGLPGKTLIGVLAVDATGDSPDFLVFHAPKDGDKTTEQTPGDNLTEEVYQTLVALPDHTASSGNHLRAAMRDAGMKFTNARSITALDDLLFSGRITEVPGGKRAIGYRAVVGNSSVTDESPAHSVPSSVPCGVPPIESGTPEHSLVSVSRNTAEHCGTLERDPGGSSCTYCDKPIPDHMHSQIARGYCNKPDCMESATTAAAGVVA